MHQQDKLRIPLPFIFCGCSQLKAMVVFEERMEEFEIDNKPHMDALADLEMQLQE